MALHETSSCRFPEGFTYIMRLGVSRMFGNNSDLIPMTYSIKSYRKRNASGFKRLFKYTAYGLLLIGILGIIFLSATRLI